MLDCTHKRVHGVALGVHDEPIGGDEKKHLAAE
jgi:hypothetical protein